MARAAGHVDVSALVEEVGFSARHWIRMAAAGRVPGARQPFGPGSSWVFDLRAVRQWWDATAKAVPEWPTSTSVGTSGGAVSRRTARSIAPRSRRDLKATLAKVL